MKKRMPFSRVLSALAVSIIAMSINASSAQDLGYIKAEEFPFEPSFNMFRGATEVEPVGEDVYTFRWGAARTMFMVTDDGVIVTDPLNVKAAKTLREEIAKLTDQPVKYMVYTHSHLDRAAGGQIFKDEGAHVIAQENCVENLRATPYPGVVLPDITFSDHYELELGGRTLELFYFGPSHDNCLITMWPRHEKALYLTNLVQPPTGRIQPWEPMGADLYFHNIVPYLTSVEDLAAREGIDQVIGGWISVGIDENRKPFLQPPIGTINAVTEVREFWETLFAAVEAELAKGTFSTQVPEKIDLTPFEDLLRYREDHFKVLVRRVAVFQTTGW